MRMALTGGKKVQGFDIAKHQEYKHGSIMTAGTQGVTAEEEGEGDEEQVTEASTEAAT